MMIVILAGFGLVLLVTALIVADVVSGSRRSANPSGSEEKTAGWVTRVRGPVHGRLENGASATFTEVVVEYYTRRGEGPYEVARKLPVGSRTSYCKGDRVIVAYDVRTPRRGRIAGRVTHWPQMGPRVGQPAPEEPQPQH